MNSSQLEPSVLPTMYPGRHEHEVLVLPCGAELLVHFEVAQPVIELAAVELPPDPHQIVAGQARAVREQVAGRRVGGGVLVLEPEIREIRPHRLVPGDLPVVDGIATSGGREGLAAGADGKKGVRRDLESLLDVAQAEALGEDRPCRP